MNTVSVTVDIDALPAKVFAVLCDVERWPEWTSTMSSVRRVDRGRLALGSIAQVRQPRLRAAAWLVTEFEDERNFTWSTHSPGLRMTAGHAIEARGSGSRVRLWFELSGFMAPLVSWLYGGLIGRYVATESQGLKKRCESAA